ncbi:MAG: hypothetical protein QW594_01480 [Candidatus Woesearchaeota archaeon]
MNKLQEQHQESDWSSCLQCDRGTCPIRGPTELQSNIYIARRKERVLALASTMLLAKKANSHSISQYLLTKIVVECVAKRG